MSSILTCRVPAPLTGILRCHGPPRCPVPPGQHLADLAGPLADLVAAAPGHVSVVVADRTGVLADIEGSRVVPAASTVKVPVLVAVLRLVAGASSGWATRPARGATGSAAAAPSRR